jgi:hypothetical protein
VSCRVVHLLAEQFGQLRDFVAGCVESRPVVGHFAAAFTW